MNRRDRASPARLPLRSVQLDEAYLRRALEEPSADIVRGFELTHMPEYELSEEVIAALLADQQSLR